MARLFVAVDLPGSVVERLDDLDRPERAGVRWVRRDRWHITLCFLGEADRGEAIAALGSLHAARTVARLGPTIERLGERVVCVPVSGLDGLVSVTTQVMEGIGEPRPSRPFRGHLTLGRARAGATRVPLVGTRFEAEFAVERVSLVESHVGSGPARYEVVGERTLTAPAP